MPEEKEPLILYIRKETSNPSNVCIDKNGMLCRSISTKKFKDNIVYNVDHILLDPIYPATYRSIVDREDYIGLIAEDVEKSDKRLAIHDLDGKAESVDWNAMIALLVAKVKYLESKIMELESNQ